MTPDTDRQREYERDVERALRDLLSVVEAARSNPPVDHTAQLDVAQAKAHAALASARPVPQEPQITEETEGK